jgi:5-methyltetrahydrofolate--homocysteine methyltransferase
MPRLIGMQAVYESEPSDYADVVMAMRAAGAGIVGGCCGTGPRHLEAIAARI